MITAIVGYLFLIYPCSVNKAKYSLIIDFDFAHRGLFSKDQRIPENSMAAFSKAVAMGYGIELDIEMTADARKKASSCDIARLQRP
jgi:hypothetical protein